MNHFPKIPLDRASDLAFLQSQLNEALQDRLSFHLPNALPGDSFRALINTHIATFLSSTMQEVTQNITINGLPPRPSDVAKGVQVQEEDDYETFDTALQARVLDRHGELERTITRVTQKRRELPEEIKRGYIPATLPTEVNEDPDIAEESMELAKPIEIARLDEVVKSYEDSVKLMKEMKGTVDAVSARIQRANEILQYIKTEQTKQGQS